MRTVLRLCLMAFWIFAALSPASGANVIFYSKADNAYGWCAGYSYGKGESCARQQCLEYGSGCELAIECDGGWSATAFAPDPLEGFGASCEWQTAGVARSIALLSCIYASHALCTTSEAFDSRGRSASETSNDAYDLAWYTQSLLVALGYDIGEVDGQVGSKTRAAIRDFQAAIGIAVTGEAEWSLMWYLTYVAGGPGQFVADTIASVDGADQHVVQTYAYRYAGLPGDDMSLTEAIAGLDDVWRRNILAAMANYARAPCAVPANAVAETEDTTVWAVSCREGDYLLGLGGNRLVVAKAEDGPMPRPLPVTCADTNPSSGNGNKPSSLTLNGPGPGMDSKPSLNTANSAGPLSSLVPVEDCPQPVATDCPPNEQTKGEKPSLITLNDPGPGKSYKPSLNTANTPGPLGDPIAVEDCPTAADAKPVPFKPSANTLNSMAPDLGAALGAAAQ